VIQNLIIREVFTKQHSITSKNIWFLQFSIFNVLDRFTILF